MAMMTDEMAACCERLYRATEAAGLKGASVMVRIGDGSYPLSVDWEDGRGNTGEWCASPGNLGGSDGEDG